MPDRKTLVAMVGLPARGKSFVARKIAGYLGWLGLEVSVFNAGDYRRVELGPHADHTFFDPDNAAAREARHAIARRALDDALGWLHAGGGVAVLDATNSTRERRRLIAERTQAAGVDLLFVEVACDDPRLIEENIASAKLRMPEYADVPAEEAARDFRMRIAHYRRIYQPLDEDALPWVRVTDFGRRRELNRVFGGIPARLGAYIGALRHRRAAVLLVRHGESVFNGEGRIGGDPPLSDRGRAFAQALAQHLATDPPAEVWTSTLERALATAHAVTPEPRVLKSLDEIDAGVCDGLTYAEMRERCPAEHAAREADKLRYRYPRGESYADVIARLDPLTLEIERRTSSLLIVGHRAVLRALHGYVTAEPAARVPHLELPLHTLIVHTLGPTGPEERRVELGERLERTRNPRA